MTHGEPDTQTFVPAVDAHAHIFTREMPLIPNPRHRPAYDFRAEAYLKILDRFGVRYGVISAASPWGDYNDYTIRSVELHPRLRGTAIVHPGRDYDFEGMADSGIVGIRLPFIGLAELPDLQGPAYRRLFRRLADLGWHVHLHVEARHIARLVPILEDSGPRVVVDHMGRPGPEDDVRGEWFHTMLAAVQRGRTWVKVSCAYRIGPVADPVFRALLAAADPTRLLWASDCPFVGHENEVTYAETVDWFVSRVNDPELRRKIFGENAYAFYFGGRLLPVSPSED